MKNPAIVTIGYNRPDSLKRLLDSLNAADYDDNVNVPLIISIDKSDSTAVIDVAEAFKWNHGDKKIIKRSENMGLKKHVLACGNLVNDYENIIMLEDDLYVSRAFYKYAVEALSFTRDNDKIAGVSLYNHRLNVHVREPFEAYDDGYDNYYFQFASSWGQAFTKSQWNSFMTWMSGNDGKALEASNFPVNVSSWSDKSWLKYYIKYMVETDKYFLYPRVGFTTNFGDAGTHEDSANCDFQISLSNGMRRKYTFSSLDESGAVYDAFFENICLKDKVLHKGECEIDLYGYKPVGSMQYMISSKPYPYKVIKSYKRALRPIDANILNNIKGKDFFVYDTHEPGTAPIISESEKILYNYRALNVKRMFKVMSYRVFGK